MPRTPTISHGDAYSLGQIAQMWDKPSGFVRQMVSEDKLSTDERGLVTNAVLREFYIQHATELDA